MALHRDQFLAFCSLVFCQQPEKTIKISLVKSGSDTSRQRWRRALPSGESRAAGLASKRDAFPMAKTECGVWAEAAPAPRAGERRRGRWRVGDTQLDGAAAAGAWVEVSPLCHRPHGRSGAAAPSTWAAGTGRLEEEQHGAGLEGSASSARSGQRRRPSDTLQEARIREGSPVQPIKASQGLPG